MTDERFQQLVTALSLTTKTLPAAHAVLVGGASLNGSAKHFKVDVGQLYRVVSKLRTTTLCAHCGQPVD